MDGNDLKMVDFHKYCEKCEYKNLPENEDPCYQCLADPVNVASHKPTHFKESQIQGGYVHT